MSLPNNNLIRKLGPTRRKMMIIIFCIIHLLIIKILQNVEEINFDQKIEWNKINKESVETICTVI